MRKNGWLCIALAGAAAGAVTGLFGAGGGMVLVPVLSLLTDLKEEEIFPSSVFIISAVCIVALGFAAMQRQIPWLTALPYMGGSAIGGLCAGIWGKRIPVSLLHRLLGGLILWGGIRYLC